MDKEIRLIQIQTDLEDLRKDLEAGLINKEKAKKKHNKLYKEWAEINAELSRRINEAQWKLITSFSKIFK